ncbi:MAG TPA: PAS domain S-box protein [Spirochaetota bacterium]|nr:PAS domain S-box protein [Spirochaetota bacterium]HPJ39611.1 PAS domain S-box protein [Spirochaetota bacterium]
MAMKEYKFRITNIRTLRLFIYVFTILLLLAGALFRHVIRNQSSADCIADFFIALAIGAIIIETCFNVIKRIHTRLEKEISDRISAEQSVRFSEEQYLSILNAMADCIHVIDRDFRIVFFNDPFIRLNSQFGFETNVNGKHLFEIFSFLSDKVRSEYRRVFHEGRIIVTQEHNFLKSSEIYTETRKIPVLRNGRVEQVITVVQDITERKKAEEELLKSEERFRQIVEKSPLPISVIDSENIVKYLNPAFTRTFGYSRDDIYTPERWFSSAFPDETYRLSMIEYWNSFLQSGTGWNSAPREITIASRDGTPRQVMSHLVMLTDEQKLALFEDFTEQRGLEEQLRQSQKMEAIGRLAGGIAHDFNNILTSIMGYSSLILSKCNDSMPYSRELQQIMKSSEMAASLTRQLLAFSRKQLLQTTAVDLNSLVDRLHTILKRIIGEDIDLVIIPEHTIDTINADPSQIEQVIMNLVVNACDAMPEGGKLFIRTGSVELAGKDLHSFPDARPGQFVKLTVTDTGRGIEQHLLPKIFEPFFSTKAAGKGTGLGLSVVYGIIKQHEGIITVSSGEGRGTTFTVYLPAGSGIAAVQQEAQSIPAEVRGNGEGILLVEDEEGVRQSVSEILRINGYSVHTAACAEEAMLLFNEKQGDISLVFSDVVMPGKNGIDLADELRSRHPGLQILLGSGYTDDKSHWPLISEKGYHFLHKPYKIPQLLSMIYRIISEQKTMQ